MRKILLAMALLLSAAACGSNPTAPASAAEIQASLTEDDLRPPPTCTRYALAGGHRTCEDPE
jgi:ABC-type glycerol-3-phosphate transport system substrate-binding protein